MFKEIMGFDTDLLKFGVAVEIKDSESNGKTRVHIVLDDGLEHKYINLSGTYLIKESSSTVLRLINARGEEGKFHIRHFTGNPPRMTIEILK